MYGNAFTREKEYQRDKIDNNKKNERMLRKSNKIIRLIMCKGKLGSF